MNRMAIVWPDRNAHYHLMTIQMTLNKEIVKIQQHFVITESVYVGLTLNRTEMTINVITDIIVSYSCYYDYN